MGDREVFTVEGLDYGVGGNVHSELEGAWCDFDSARDQATSDDLSDYDDVKVTCWQGGEQQWTQMRSEWSD